jgi:hypothetical protein
MRFINIATFQPSQAWRDRAERATRALNDLVTNADRVAYINAHAQIWRDLRADLLEHFGTKCWFTDAPEIIAHLDVEHFRPKAKAVDLQDTEREGYWWLAFDFDNLRLCGQIPNRQYKRCLFPLMPGSFIASSAARQIWQERPVFLDPTKPEDVQLVAYGEDGAMRPKPGAVPNEAMRVETTDKEFGFSAHQPLVEERQKIWKKCTLLIHDFMRSKEREKESGSDPVLTSEQRNILRQLIDLANSAAPFASVARSCLLQSPYSWAGDLTALTN